MPATPIGDPVPGESLAGIDPQLLQDQPNLPWRHRLNLFTGRALTADALDSEQLYRSGMLATLGQAVTPGIVSGLVLTIDTEIDPLLSVTAGYGIGASGEDVLLARTLQTHLSSLAVVDATGAPFVDANTKQTVNTFQQYAAGSSGPPAGILVLQPIVAQVSGLFDDASTPIEVSGNLSASCDQDPAEYAFEDWQIADGLRLAFFPWPLAALVPAPAATFRNRLAYTIFDAEAALAPGDQLPWMFVGVPVALIAFQTSAAGQWKASTAYAAGTSILDSNGFVQTIATAGTSGATQPGWSDTPGGTTQDGSAVWKNAGLSWQPSFVDRSAVVRPGGLPRARSVLPGGQAIQPALAETRIAQLSEQLSAQLSLPGPFTSLSSIAATLPPSGVLPAAAMDFTNKKNLWLPPAWSVSAGPVHLEELEDALQTGMLMAPLDPSANEDVEVLVPLPDALYDPDILVTETVAPDFQNELDLAAQQRNAVLRDRKTLQLQLNVLQTVLGPNAPQENPNLIDLNAGLTSDEQTGRDEMPPDWPQPTADSNADQTFGTGAPATWQSAVPYVVGQLVVDSGGNFQVVTKAGSSGNTAPAWNSAFGATTTDGTVTWLNSGSGTWTPNTSYVARQIVFDADGNIQIAKTIQGPSGRSQYIWNSTTGGTTADHLVTWLNSGPQAWQPNFNYAAKQAVIDSNGNVQSVQNAGKSGSAAPAWGNDTGETTPDNAVVWLYEGLPTLWARNTVYIVGQFFVDANGNIQQVEAVVADRTGADATGTSGATQFIWNATAGQATVDGGVSWINDGPGSWQPNTAYAAGQFIVDASGNLQTVETGGTSGAVAPVWNAVAGATTADKTVSWVCQAWSSNDLQTLKSAASQAPYTTTVAWPGWQPSQAYSAGQIVIDSNGNLQITKNAGTSAATAPKWSTSTAATVDGNISWTLLPEKPVPIALLSADDWNDLASNGLQHFIDRLNAKINSANDLLDTAFLTSQTDIYRFRQNVLGASDASRLATSPILANIATGVTATATAQNLRDYISSISTPAATPAPTVTEGAAAPSFSAVVSKSPVGMVDITRNQTNIVSQQKTSAFTAVATEERFTGVTAISETAVAAPVYTVQVPGVTSQATTSDIQQQQPIAGAQIDIRTLSIAERLTPPPSQEALFYAVSNRGALMQLLADLEMTVDDLPFLVDGTPSSDPSQPIPTETHFVWELRDVTARNAVFGKIQSPAIIPNTDEAGLFSAGIRVLEQHSQLLRALEARVADYSNFVGLCTTALGNVQNDVGEAQTALAQVENQLNQARQNLAFTNSLLNDERQRVLGVNTQRTQILNTSVQVVVYTRPRTLDTADDVPSRQLVPGNVANPVPTCLQAAIAVPPELREIVALLKEAPATWLPSVAAQVPNLERPSLLQGLALDTQVRATAQLRLPLPASSALLTPTTYGPTIASVYRANQQVVRGFQTQRSAFVPNRIASLSWSAQAAAVAGLTTIADLGSSDSVHAEIAGAVALAQQQISSVAACVYSRANLALPVDRLAWAEFLRGPGLGIQLQSLAVLPNWNTQSYTDRQQMQQLVDWLFAQIDTTVDAAVAFMSDVVRVCLLLASNAPVDAVIAAAVSLRTQPSLGSIVKLNLPSVRVGSGMFVQLFSNGDLAAEAVVSDLDSTSVSATVTAVHLPGVILEANDVAHFATQQPQAAALRAFSA